MLSDTVGEDAEYERNPITIDSRREDVAFELVCAVWVRARRGQQLAGERLLDGVKGCKRGSECGRRDDPGDDDRPGHETGMREQPAPREGGEAAGRAQGVGAGGGHLTRT